jgi:HK97 family phage prohead protease
LELLYKDSSITVEPPDEKGFIEGYASVYGVVDHQNERTMPGAFERALKNPRRVKLLWQHDFKTPIGRITKMWEDDRGLRFRGKLNIKTDWGRNAYEALLAGDVSANSIGYIEVKGKNAINDEDGVKDLNELDLMEISTVSFPSNEAATVEEIKSDIEELEVKAGRVLSGVNAQDISALRASLSSAIDYCDAVLGRAAPAKPAAAQAAAPPAQAPAKAPPGKSDNVELLIKKLEHIKEILE